MRSARLIFQVACLFVFTSTALSSSRVTAKEAEQWREDLQQFALEAPRLHKNFYHSMTKGKFDAALQRLQEQVPILSRERIIVELARIVAMVGDGHTHMALRSEPISFRSYPVKLYMFRDGLYVRAADRDHASIVGGKVVRIGKLTTDQAWKEVSTIVSMDSPMQLQGEVPSHLTIPEVLEALDIVDDTDKFTLVVEKDGKQISAQFKPVPIEEDLAAGWKNAVGWVDARDGAPVPLWLKDPGNLFWYEYLTDSRTLYVQYNAVYPKPDETIAGFFTKVMKFTESNPVDKFVLDVRLNHGGNNFFNLPIIHGFIRSDKVNQRGKLFTIIGRQTFSAAMNCVNLMEKHTNTLFVGEPTGATPNHYGDARSLVLTNSRVPVRLSTLWWQDNDPRDLRKWRPPDIAAELTFDQYRRGFDPALNAILTYDNKPSIADQVRAAITRDDAEGALKAVKQFKEDPANYYVSAENELNLMGYALLANHQEKAAVGVFSVIVEAYPDSSNAYDSLAEGYMAIKNNELAIKNYKKSLELNPDNGNARIMLQRLSQ